MRIFGFMRKLKRAAFLALAFLFLLSGAIFYFIASGLADEVLACARGGRIITLSSAAIKNSMPADKWVIATIHGEIEDKIVLKREFMPDLVFYLEPLPAFYNYYVPVNDARWKIVYSDEKSVGGSFEYVDISLPEILFDDTATIVDISKLGFSSKNSKFTRLESTAEMLRSRLVMNVVDNYRKRGGSFENFALARSAAEKTLAQFAKNRLLEHGVKVSDGAVFRFNWIKNTGGNFEEKADTRNTEN